MQENKRSRGRPPATSATDLQEAAYELFMTHGYEATNAAMITSAIGASRSTFFNYFRVKSDIFWLQTDAAITTFITELHQRSQSCGFHAALTGAAMAATSDWDSNRVPWVYHNYELIGSPVAVLESSAPRLARVAQAITQTLQELSPATSHSKLLPLSSMCVGALAGAVLGWADSGANRGVLSAHVKAALAPLESTFANF